MQFKDLALHPVILKALTEKGYVTPTPIQQKAIPVALQSKDILGCAQTGTGKTAAFSIPILNALHTEQSEKGKGIRALILTPTRELALQIHENLQAYAKYTQIRSTYVFGGVKQGKQVAQLRKKPQILVATPGRLMDLINQKIVRLDAITHFVLDEADRMLDMGFIHDIKKLIKILPKKRQSLFFSATLPDNIIALSKEILFKPEILNTAPVSSTVKIIHQKVYYTNRTSKRSLLTHIIKDRKIEQALVFTRTKYGADKLCRSLKRDGIQALALHGNKSQPQRELALKKFKGKQIQLLVATDIASRGIDIDALSHVINYDIPETPETYVHRIGRTGRAGKAGESISICEPEHNVFLKDIERLIKKKIEVIKDHPFPQTDKPMTAAEKKEWNKEKQKRKMEAINRKRNRNSKSPSKMGRR
ncbi:MAG: DEAD/DEAH box helicase [Bacteroidota bacterium]